MRRIAVRAGCRRGRLLGVAIASVLATSTLLGGTAAGAPAKARTAKLTTITVDTLPIANALPMDLGIKKGFFEAQGIEIKKTTLQSGNDIVLALANKNGDVGYLGYVPMMIARTTGIPLTLVAASEDEGTSEADNWQNILVKGSSSIRTPADLAGKTIAVNALKGVGEVVIKAALKKRGVDPNSIKLVAMPFPTMRTALNNGQVDAIWTPEPFLSQALNIDGARSVMAPGPVLGKYFPNGGYAALHDWTTKNPGLAKAFRTAMNESLTYAQSHPDEIRALLPAGSQNSRLAVWSPLVDRDQLLTLAKYAKEFGVISTLPNFTQLVPSNVLSGTASGTLEGTVGPGFTITLKQNGKKVSKVTAGKYLFIISDKSAQHDFHLAGPGVNKKTSVGKTGTTRWTVTLKKGTYTYVCDPHASQMKGSFKVG
jgi:NitT/TauT family transport system substrate-binding protein